MEVRQIAGAIGAEITGIDLARGLAPAEARAAARGAARSRGDLLPRPDAVARRASSTFASAVRRADRVSVRQGARRVFPQITPVIKLEHEKINFGGIWHSDTAYLEAPPMGTHADRARGAAASAATRCSPTCICAYETLSDGMKRLLDGLVAINSSAKADVVADARGPHAATARARTRSKEYRAEHPVVRTHPETGRKALYVNVGHTVASRA